MKMPKTKTATQTSKLSLAKIIWSNIIRQQYLLGVTDQQLCDLLDVTPRTLLNYRKDPAAITLRQLEALVNSFGTDAEALLRQ